ncbi:hypothetical protein LJY25_16770 [Hymenobacter sp. BT175]|uniref:hypothetical protein n=1 Tax=Hymenobacter translucens TaxID=2886507 RepID=UPI001D0E7243|nr:hypothetical protein [Hymenobacter translucens]MCC2548105.1 hypothetical protein [Hymenobacter translucens]
MSRFPLFLLVLLFLSGGLAVCRYSPQLASRPAAPASAPYQIGFHLKNNSEAQPETDLRVQWDAKPVALDTLRYTSSSAGVKHHQLTTTPGEHLLRIVNQRNQLQLDTTVVVREPETNVFITFAYRTFTDEQLAQIRASDPPEGVEAVVAALSEPKSLVVHIAHGPISPID